MLPPPVVAGLSRAEFKGSVAVGARAASGWFVPFLAAAEAATAVLRIKATASAIFVVRDILASPGTAVAAPTRKQTPKPAGLFPIVRLGDGTRHSKSRL